MISFLAVTACAPNNEILSIDETGSETASEVAPINIGGGSDPEVLSEPIKNLILNQAMPLRILKGNVLEPFIEIPAGTQITIPEHYEIKYYDYRNSSGTVERSSTGFLHPIKIVSVANSFASQFTEARIASINSTEGGLYLFASIVGSNEGSAGSFSIITATEANPGYLKYYGPNAKPRFNFTNSIVRRFGSGVNKKVEENQLGKSVITKWQKIYLELVRVADRTQSASKALLIMDLNEAKKRSLEFEQSGLVPMMGAWTIATQATAVRHGFANVPCAEFQSEILREAYQRAGYRITEDFNSQRGNQLIWSHTAAVVNFSTALFRAGWIPWDASKYRPIVGSFLMNGSGMSPGHTYISAGMDGRLIVDNGAPQGRDLGKTTDKTIAMMFQTGVFFLPPGINPPSWSE